MPKWETRQCGVTRGRCASCGEEADLRLTESSFKRGWRDVFDSGFDARVDRRVSCSACQRTYPVRAGDLTPDAATRRDPAVAQAARPADSPAPVQQAVQEAVQEAVQRRRADDAVGRPAPVRRRGPATSR